MLRESTPVDVNPPSLRIALISPKGPLYRHRGGIFGKSLRYMPLTLPTLAALVPPELNATIQCFDEGIADVPMDLKADLVGLTVITGTAPRAYALLTVKSYAHAVSHSPECMTFILAYYV